MGQILPNQNFVAVSLGSYNGGLRGLLIALATLVTHGVEVDLTALYRDRSVKDLGRSRLAGLAQVPPLSPTAWLVNGSRSRKQTEKIEVPPPLALETLVSSPLDSESPRSSQSNGNYPPDRDGSHGDQQEQSVHRTSQGGQTPTSFPSHQLSNVAPKIPSSGFTQSTPRSLSSTSQVNPGAIPTSYPVSVSQSPNGLKATTMNHVEPTHLTEPTLLAYQTYQETMRQFLVSQERVFHSLLNNNQIGQLHTTQLNHLTPRSLPRTVQYPQPTPNEQAKGAPQMSAVPKPVPSAASARSAPPTSFVAAPAPATPAVSAIPLSSPVPESKAKLPSSPPIFPSAQDASVPAPEPVGSTSIEAASLTQTLLDLVSERTGYPTEMLSLDQDIEAELGIDSIKRVEILGALEKRLPPTLTEQLRTKMDSLTQVKTFNGLVDAVLQLSANTSETQEAARLGKPKAGTDSVPRCIIQAQVQPLPENCLHSLSGFYWVTEDDLGLAPKVVAAIQQQGAQARMLSQSTLRSNKNLTAEFQAVRSQYAAVAGLIHLTALSLNLPEDLKAWRNRTLLDVKRLFTLVQLSSADAHQTGQFRVVSVSLLGGAFGRKQVGACGHGSATGGAHNGFLKTLAQEWPGVQAKAVDCDAAQPPDHLVQQILQELCATDSVVEVGYPQGQRTCFDARLKPLSAANSIQQLRPTADWVVLVTGGSRGITAEVMKSFMIPGMTLIIVGRSPEPAPESPATEAMTEPAELRRLLFAQAKAEGRSPTPAQIEKTLQSLLNDRVSRENLRWFRKRGTVEYHGVDVRDADTFGRIIDGIYHRYGRLDAVIHGAGIIEDKLIIDKQLDSFDRVFDTKADSAFILSQHLRPESLKLVVFFASVAGRFGNRGQSDYGATNEVVTRLAWQLDQCWPKTRVLAIQWGPWDSTGMASGAVKRQFRERGIVPIPLDAGGRFFVEEVLYGSKGEVEVVAGEGPWVTTPSLPILPSSSLARTPNTALN